MPDDPRDELILSLSQKLFICSRLLTCAAMRLGWDSAEVRELVERLKAELPNKEESKC